jgi:nitrogen fixation protein NifB
MAFEIYPTKDNPKYRGITMNQLIDRDTAAPANLKQKLRIAAASKGSGLVDQHFGHADSFLIYEVDGTQATWLETRTCTPYCQGGHGETSSLERVINLLSDCQAVLVSRIGAGPDDQLREVGIEPVQVYDQIETALFDFYETYQKSGFSSQNSDIAFPASSGVYEQGA